MRLFWEGEILLCLMQKTVWATERAILAIAVKEWMYPREPPEDKCTEIDHIAMKPIVVNVAAQVTHQRWNLLPIWPIDRRTQDPNRFFSVRAWFSTSPSMAKRCNPRFQSSVKAK